MTDAEIEIHRINNGFIVQSAKYEYSGIRIGTDTDFYPTAELMMEGIRRFFISASAKEIK
jgi:hypothetical protein